MPKRYPFSVMVLMLAAIVFASGAAARKSDRPSRLVLSAARTTYVIAEPITLSFDLLNDSRKTISGYYAFDLREDPYNSDLTITYRRKGDASHVYALRTNSDPLTTRVALEKTRIAPHDRLSTQSLLLYDPGIDRFVFDEPGRYEFRAKFEYESGQTIESNPLWVTVMPAPRDESPEALATWKNADVARAIQGNAVEGQKEPAVIERLRTLLTRFPSSLYAREARRSIVSLYQAKSAQGRLGGLQESLLALAKSQP